MRHHLDQPKRGFTRVELLVIVTVLIGLVALLIPALQKARAKAQRIGCVSCLKQIGLGFRIFSSDHGDRFPMQTWTNLIDWEATGSFPLRYFVGLSNELSTPYVLVCPSDTRKPAALWADTTRTNVSYFIGLQATETNPDLLLAGDRNLSNHGQPVPPGLFPLTTNSALRWTDELHRGVGNVALADGSVQQTSSARLQAHAQTQETGTNWLALP